MSLEFIIHSTVRSGYFHFGNNRFFVKFPLFKYENLGSRALKILGICLILSYILSLTLR